ncbi:MAG: ABC-type transporter ATP-binding protein EcsA [Bacteroidota bacterium]|jgi:ABC-2 type transport system ATP-binding protein
MIEWKNITVNYGEHNVIDGLSAKFPLGKTIGVAGLNGAGKTTLFNCFSKNNIVYSGDFLINNKEIIKRDISYLTTTNFFYSYITGGEYLGLFKNNSKLFNEESLAALLAIPLEELIDNYSTGMKKKLALMSILKQDSPIYIFDEPFNGLDLESNKILEIILEKLKSEGKTIFISSHIIAPLKNICDEILILHQGKIKNLYNAENFEHIENDLYRDMEQNARLILGMDI